MLLCGNRIVERSREELRGFRECVVCIYHLVWNYLSILTTSLAMPGHNSEYIYLGLANGYSVFKVYHDTKSATIIYSLVHHDTLTLGQNSVSEWRTRVRKGKFFGLWDKSLILISTNLSQSESGREKLIEGEIYCTICWFIPEVFLPRLQFLVHIMNGELNIIYF